MYTAISKLCEEGDILDVLEDKEGAVDEVGERSERGKREAVDWNCGSQPYYNSSLSSTNLVICRNLIQSDV